MPVMSKLADCVMAGGVLVGKPLLSAAATTTRIDTDDNDNTESKKLTATTTTTTTFTSDSLRSIQTSFIVDGIKQGEGGCAKLCPQGGPIESVT